MTQSVETKIRIARVGDIAEQIRGVTFSKGEASAAPASALVAILTASNITEDGLRLSSVLHVPEGKVSVKQRLQRNDLLITASSGSLSVVGRAALVRDQIDASFGAFCKVLRPSQEVNPNYFAHFFRTPQYRARVSALAAGANINNLRNEDLDNLPIPLPPLPEQRRIAAILDQADELRTRRRRALALVDEFEEELFMQMFASAIPAAKLTLLGQVAHIASGITKGRKATGVTLREVAYLAVSNVQDGRLNMSVVKRIAVSEPEVARYRLERDDLLLTEGGDPDKLGRGTLWRGELPEAIHQNHIFRVRLHDAQVRPIYLAWFVRSAAAKSYFARSAKQTTGIASINMAQLRGLPVAIPTTAQQDAFIGQIGLSARLRKLQTEAMSNVDELFASLQHRAFRGEL